MAYVLVHGGEARAGAFLWPAGQGQVIVATVLTEAWRQFDASGRFVASPRFRKFQALAYAEYGVTDWLTAVIKPSVTNASFASGNDTVAANSTGSEFGARVHVATFRDWTIAAQADVIAPSPNLGRNTALLTDAAGGADLRLLAGTGFKVGSWPSFVDVDVSYRYLAGRPPNEVHGDLTFGTRPVPRVLLLLQSFNAVSDGSGAPPFGRYWQSKLQASLVYDIGQWSLQGGLVTTVAGVNAPAEQGLVAAVWRRF